jgi:hypothetical protein
MWQCGNGESKKFNVMTSNDMGYHFSKQEYTYSSI